jgi:NAD+ diphosphatase
MIPETSITFAAGTLDRAAHLRGDVDRLCADPSARALALWRGRPLIALSAEGHVQAAHWLPTDATLFSQAGDWTFLGLEDGAPRFAVDVSAIPSEGESAPKPIHGAKFIDLRSIMAELGAEDAAAAATAKGLWEWHGAHRFCARCGQPSDVDQAGWRRRCPACGGLHFPRTDPVVIMLVLSGDKVLLGRQAGWEPRVYSLLAGFMEPGETLEAAVRREVFEETGVETGRVGYLASQPWPFPSSLMFGCAAEALGEDLTIDRTELEDALWVSKAEVARTLAGEGERFAPARKGAIARHILEAWVSGVLDGWERG